MTLPKLSLFDVREFCSSRTDGNGRNQLNGVGTRPTQLSFMAVLLLLLRVAQSLQSRSKCFLTVAVTVVVFSTVFDHQLSAGQPVGKMANEFFAARPAIGQHDATNARMGLAQGVNIVGFGLADVLVQRSGSLASANHVPEAESRLQQFGELLWIGKNRVVAVFQIRGKPVGYVRDRRDGSAAPKAKTVARDPPEGIHWVTIVLMHGERLDAGVRTENERVRFYIWIHFRSEGLRAHSGFLFAGRCRR